MTDEAEKQEKLDDNTDPLVVSSEIRELQTRQDDIEARIRFLETRLGLVFAAQERTSYAE